MATLLFAWELGGGLGHLARFHPIACRLRESGHEVVLALGDLSRAERFFADFVHLQAPLSRQSRADHILYPSTFADILYGCGCASPHELAPLTAAWRSMFRLIRPDVIVLDHSPLALLASQGLPLRRVLLGTGFACPPDISPLPDLRPWEKNYPDRLQMTEQQVLGVLNQDLAAQGQSPLPRVATLLQRVDENILATFRELDHYPQREGGRYFGTWSHAGGRPPVWPPGTGPKAFAYLKPFTALPTLLADLERRDVRAIVYLGGSQASYVADLTGSRIRFETEPLDMTEVAAQCDLAILNAGHGATAAMLLAGKPILEIPIVVEQYHVAENVVRLGAGVRAPADNPADVIQTLGAMLDKDRFARAARSFADRHKHFDPQVQIARVTDRLEQVLTP